MSRSIQLHADLSIDPAREAEAIEYFETVASAPHQEVWGNSRHL
jgi:hypothetical protein